MRKTLKNALTVVLTLSLCTAMTACAKKEKKPDAETLKKYVGENNIRKLLSRHKNISVKSTYYKDGEVLTVEDVTMEADRYYATVDDTIEIYVQEDILLNTYDDGETSQYTRILYEDPTMINFFMTENLSGSLFDFPATETLLEASEKDGILTVLTEETDKETILEDIAVFSDPGAFTYEDGMKIQIRYEINTETTELKFLEAHLIDAKGNSSLFLQMEISFDTESIDSRRSDVIRDYITALSDPENICKMTLVFAPGTESEHQETYQLVKRSYFDVFYHDDYVETYYEDPECTKVFAGGAEDEEPASERTLYIP